MRLLSPIPESADGTIINIAGHSSAPLTLITPSSTIRATDIAMPVTSKILSNLPAPKWTLIAHCKSNLQVIRLKSLEKECLNTCNKFYLLPLVCINHRLLLFIIGDPDIDFLSSHLPTSPPIALALNVGLDTKTTFACEILNFLAMKLTLTFINSNLTVDQVEGSVQGAVDFLQQPSSIFTGSCLH